MAFRVAKPVNGYELKLEVLKTAIAWELFPNNMTSDDTESIILNEEEMEVVNRVAERCFAVLDEFKEE